MFFASAAGPLLAAFTRNRLSRRFGIGPTTIGGRAGLGPGDAAHRVRPRGQRGDPVPRRRAAPRRLHASSSTTSSQVSYRQAICPPRLQGRMNSVMRFIVWGDDPARDARRRRARHVDRAARDDRRSARSEARSSFLWIVLSPQRHLREMPEPIDDEPPPTRAGRSASVVADRLPAARRPV